MSGAEGQHLAAQQEKMKLRSREEPRRESQQNRASTGGCGQLCHVMLRNEVRRKRLPEVRDAGITTSAEKRCLVE